MFLDFSQGFVSAWVNGCGYVVVISQDCSPDFSDIWYNGSSFQSFCCSSSVQRDDDDFFVVIFSMVFPRQSGLSPAYTVTG